MELDRTFTPRPRRMGGDEGRERWGASDLWVMRVAVREWWMNGSGEWDEAVRVKAKDWSGEVQCEWWVVMIIRECMVIVTCHWQLWVRWTRERGERYSISKRRIITAQRNGLVFFAALYISTMPTRVSKPAKSYQERYHNLCSAKLRWVDNDPSLQTLTCREVNYKTGNAWAALIFINK